MQTVAIVGVGLIGASFGLAIRKGGFTGTILGVSSPPALEAGLAAGAISSAATLQEAVANADLIYLAQPVDRIVETLVHLGPIARRETLITDAGSTKSTIVQAARSHLQFAPFLGGHPMAGKETRGAQAADADLFRGRLYVLTPESEVPNEFRELLKKIGANVLQMSAEEHDATVSLTSHLPQLLSTALAAFLEAQKQPALTQVFGSGLLDMTRLALSPAELWASILSTNKANVIKGLELYMESLMQLRKALEAEELDSVFELGSRFARHLRKLDN